MSALISAPLRVLQLSDPHLFANPARRLLGITTRTSFEAVLALALEHSTPAAALILTGDLVQDESPAAHAYLRNALDATALPYHCLAGNHDHHDLLQTHFSGDAIALVQRQRLPPWNLLLLNSRVTGHNRGGLQREQLADLSRLLTDNVAPTLIFLHHHPLPINSAWIDTLDVENGADLLRICDQHPQVKAVIFGHIHQNFTQRRGSYQLLGTPSTCVQFQPGSAKFAVDEERLPGYRELLLHPDGRLTTRVIRLAHYHELPLAQSTGY